MKVTMRSRVTRSRRTLTPPMTAASSPCWARPTPARRTRTVAPAPTTRWSLCPTPHMRRTTRGQHVPCPCPLRIRCGHQARPQTQPHSPQQLHPSATRRLVTMTTRPATATTIMNSVHLPQHPPQRGATPHTHQPMTTNIHTTQQPSPGSATRHTHQPMTTDPRSTQKHTTITRPPPPPPPPQHPRPCGHHYLIIRQRHLRAGLRVTTPHPRSLKQSHLQTASRRPWRRGGMQSCIAHLRRRKRPTARLHWSVRCRGRHSSLSPAASAMHHNLIYYYYYCIIIYHYYCNDMKAFMFYQCWNQKLWSIWYYSFSSSEICGYSFDAWYSQPTVKDRLNSTVAAK